MYIDMFDKTKSIISGLKNYFVPSSFDMNLDSLSNAYPFYSIFDNLNKKDFNYDFSNTFNAGVTNFYNSVDNINFSIDTFNNCNFNNNFGFVNNFTFNNADIFSNINKGINWNNNKINQSFNKSNGSLGTQLAKQASSYIKKVNSDNEGNRLFSNGITRPWCADFVVYNMRKTYSGNIANSLKGVASVAKLRDWGDTHECYRKLPSSNKSKFIAENVKVGDIMIEKEPNGKKSHCGIVTEVHADGSFKTVEGNASNAVGSRTYNANSSTLSGFILMDKYKA